ncbi:hypothetical protein F511_15526 [Dorcoceras hygrometricum]|uniref:Uncharacterized protein n=1 Tax=Dorcoceras hygrometricum TaxID=472368 RepID=A0A2Z7ALU3_9LAMI|nr:hypothetical protein F511_15526 [Dorcoceras hygrometricum]
MARDLYTIIPSDSIGYPCMRARGESSTTKHRLLHASGPHPIPPPNDPKGVGKRVKVRRLSCRVSMKFRVVRTNQNNQDLGLIHSTNDNHLESPNEGSLIDHQVTIHTSSTMARDLYTIIPSDSIGYPCMRARGESSTTKHRLLHASGPHPIPPPNDPKGVGKRVKVRRLSCRVSMKFRVVRTNQNNQDLGLIHSTNDNHLESPNEGSLIDHQVTIHLHAQNITMFPTNETWYFTLQMLVSSSGGLILILTAQSTRNVFRMHSDY